MRTNTKKLVLLAMMTAVAYLSVALIRIPVVLFLNYEPKDVIITTAGFLMGPMASFIISLVVAAIEMVTFSGTGPIGCLMNLISSASFACTAAALYKRKRSMRGAILGLAAGAITMVSVMLLWNYLITPLYMGIKREEVAALLIPAFLPFNALKAGFNSSLTLALYKPLVSALRRAGLIENRPHSGAHTKTGIYLLAAGLLVTCVLLLLALQGKI